MIDKKDLPLLLFLEQKLIDSKDFNTFNFSVFKNDGFENKSHFNNLAKQLIEYGIADEVKSNAIRTDFIFIKKTDLTGFKKLQDIFDKQNENDLEANIKSENLLLTNNELKYKQTIREQEKTIRDLTERKLKREFIISIISLILGILLKHYFDKYIGGISPDQKENHSKKLQFVENYRDTKSIEQKSLIPK